MHRREVSAQAATRSDSEFTGRTWILMAAKTRDLISLSPMNPTSEISAARRDLPGFQAWKFNFRRLLWTIALTVVAAPVFLGWYRFQHRRHATAMLDRAKALQRQNDWRGAAIAFHQYLRLRADDAEALILRAQAFEKLALDPDQKQLALSYYRQAVRANPDRLDLLLRSAELQYESGHYSEAADAADQVRKALSSQASDPTIAANQGGPDRLAAERLYAVSVREQTGPGRRVQVGEAVRVYEDALKSHPGDIVLSTGLAQLLARQAESFAGEERDAVLLQSDHVIDEMVDRNLGNVKALLGRYHFQTEQAQRTNDQGLQDRRRKIREQDLAALLKAAPEDPDVLIAVSTNLAEQAAREAERAGSEFDAATAKALAASADEKRKAALDFGRQLLEVAPEDRRSFVTVANLYAATRDWQAAIDTLQTGLKRVGRDDLELRRLLLQLYLSVGDFTSARSILSRIEPAIRRMIPYLAVPLRGRLAEELELADAQIQLLEGKMTTALPRLKRLAVNVTEGNPRETLEERQRRWRLVAGAYSRAGMHDLAGAAYDQLVHLNPTSREYHLRAAAEWRSSGDLDRAIQRFEAATVGGGDDQNAWLALAETHLSKQLRKAGAGDRDWSAFEAAIKQARGRRGNSHGVTVLLATAAIARNDRLAALESLKALACSADVDVAQLPRLATLLQDAGGNSEADAALERFRELGGDPNEFAIVKSDVLNRRGETTDAIAVLEQALKQVPETGRNSIVRRLVEIEIDSGSMQSARGRLLALRQANVSNLWVYETAADLAIIARDYDDLENCERELEVQEGPGGTSWRYVRVIRLLETTPDKAGTPLEINRLVSEIEATRPSWHLIKIVRGVLAERSARFDVAIDYYQDALRMGVRNLTALQHLVATLYRQNRFTDVAAYIQQMGQVAALSGEISAQAVPANLQAGRIGDALRVARAAAELRPDDPVSQLWYAQCLALGGKTSESETVFRKAIKLAPADLRAWSGLVWFYGRSRRLADGRNALDELVAHVELAPFDREIVVARGSDLIGDRQRAEQSYLRLVAAHKTNLKLLEEVGRFFLRFDHNRALDMFQQALKVDPQSNEARRHLAVLWGLHGNDADLGRAIEILGQGDGAVASDDRRMQAALLVVSGGDERCRQAVDLLTGLVESSEGTLPVDRLLLARAYEGLQEIDEAQNQYETLLRSQTETPFQILFVRFLNRQSRLARADSLLSRIEQVDSNNQQVLELRVDWLKRSQRTTEIEKIVDRFLAVRMKGAKNDAQKQALLRYAADLLTAAELEDAAEKKYREIALNYPAKYDLLAIWLAERGRIEEALALCHERSTGADGTSVAAILVRILTVAACFPPRTDFDPAPAEEIIATAGDSGQVDSQFLLQLGVLRAMQGRNDEAISIYERALPQELENPIVLNNLAVVLAEIPSRQHEALQCIDKALAAFPDSLEYLDTKGLVLLGTGSLAEAREVFERLCRSNPKNPRYQLHLAMALNHLGDATKAREHARVAIDNRIEKEFLTPLERQFVREAKSELKLIIQDLDPA